MIFGPMRQVGWAKACSTVTERICSSEARRNGPPEAVSSKRLTSLICSPRKHCQMALCSLSTGRMGTPACCASRITRWPAITRVSLLARAIALPILMAASVGSNPTRPEVAATTISAPAYVATSNSPCSRKTTLGNAARAASAISGASSKQATSEG